MNIPFFYQPLDGASSTLAVAHAVGSPSLVVQTGDAPLFSSPSTSNPIRVTVVSALGRCHYKVTARNGNVLTVAGSIDGYNDLPFNIGDKVGVLVSAATIGDIQTSSSNTVNALNSIQLTPGPQGSTGDQGDRGPQGFQGAQGTVGSQGNLGPQGINGNNASVAGSTGQIQYNDAGAFGGSSSLTTTTDTPLSIVYSNNICQTTTASHASINVENPDAHAQSQIQFSNGGTPTGKIRNDYVGGMNLVAYQNGSHTFICGGDVGQESATVVASIGITGIVLNKTTVTDGSMVTTGGNLRLGQTGDAYGPTYLDIKNGVGANGAIFTSMNTNVTLIDFGFKTGTNIQSNLRYECRTSSIFNQANASYGEFQYNMNATGGAGYYTYPLTIGHQVCTFFSPPIDTSAAKFPGRVGINNSNPNAKLHITGDGNYVDLILQAPSGGAQYDLLQCQDTSGNTLSAIDAKGYIRSKVGSGAPTDSPADGAMYVDDQAGVFYVRVNSTWKKVTLT